MIFELPVSIIFMAGLHGVFASGVSEAKASAFAYSGAPKVLTSTIGKSGRMNFTIACTNCLSETIAIRGTRLTLPSCPSSNFTSSAMASPVMSDHWVISTTRLTRSFPANLSSSSCASFLISAFSTVPARRMARTCSGVFSMVIIAYFLSVFWRVVSDPEARPGFRLENVNGGCRRVHFATPRRQVREGGRIRDGNCSFFDSAAASMSALMKMWKNAQ